jgi:hypothetical protein
LHCFSLISLSHPHLMPITALLCVS